MLPQKPTPKWYETPDGVFVSMVSELKNTCMIYHPKTSLA